MTDTGATDRTGYITPGTAIVVGVFQYLARRQTGTECGADGQAVIVVGDEVAA